jgi:hypothetical protein
VTAVFVLAIALMGASDARPPRNQAMASSLR